MTKQEDKGTIRALLEERRGCVMRKQDSRVADIDRELQKLGAAAQPAHAKAATREEPQKTQPATAKRSQRRP